jgi:hypothetical protein
MSKIAKNERLPSCEVNIVLLKELENYFNNELPNVFFNKMEYLELDYSILIEDNFASEIFRSIDEYYSLIFTNSTSKIAISVKIKNSDIKEKYIKEKNIDRLTLKDEDYLEINEIKEAIPYVYIDIAFKPNSVDDSIRISYEGRNARAMVIAVYDAIIRIIEPYKNHNSLYNPRDY